MNAATPRRHLITLAEMSRAEMQTLFALADRLRESDRPQVLAGRTVVNLFFEPSTRTRVSFELAAMRLRRSGASPWPRAGRRRAWRS